MMCSFCGAFSDQKEPALSPSQPPDMVGILQVVGRGRGLVVTSQERKAL